MTDLTRSIECPTCKCDLWDVWGDTANCANCGYERPYHYRTAKDDKVTPSQEKSAQRIKRYFDGSQFSIDGEPTTKITKWETELQKGTGYYFVVVETGNSVWSRDGGHFAIGRRGGIRVLSIYRLTDDVKDQRKHIAKMVGGKVGW
jgi:hypothetical protein